MFKKLRILAFLIMMTLVFGMSAQEVCAKEKVDDHLSLEMQVEQNTDENSVNVKIAVQNTGSGQVENLKISGSIPAGMEISDNQSNSLEVETSAPGTREELEYSLVVSSEDDENINDNTKPSDTPNDNSSNDTGTKDDSHKGNNVDTGDHAPIGLYVILGSGALILAAVIVIKKRRLKAMLSLLLCISMVLPLCTGAIPVKAAESTKKVVEVSEEITLNGKTYVINAKAEYDEVEAVQVSGDIVTRAEWIQTLVDAMGYSEHVVEYDGDELPYTDIQEHENLNAILLAYANGFIPENGETEFNPDESATREFAATTSVLALGFVPIQDVVCDDVNEITYKQEVETAVAMDIFRLDNNKFYPTRELSQSEADAAIDGIKGIVDSEKIDESYESDIEYKEGVIELPEDCTYSVDGNRIFLDDQNMAEKLSEGTILVLPDQTPYKLISVTSEDGKYIVETEVPEIEETVDSIDVQGYGTMDMSGFIPAEGVTLVNTYSRAARGNIADASGSLGGPGEIKFDLKKSLGDGELFGTFKIDLPKVLYKADVDLGWSGFDVNNVYLKLPAEIEIDGGFKFYQNDGNFGRPWEPKGGIFELGKVPVTGVPGATVYVQVAIYYSVEGRVHMVYKLDGTTGIQVLNNRLRMIDDLNSKLELPELEASAKIGPRVAGLLEICNRWDLIDFNASVGAGFTGTASVPNLNLFCLDANIYMYGEISALQEGVVGDWLDIGYTWEFWSKDNSPLKKNWHFENLLKVDECTATSKGTIKGMVAKADDRSAAIKNATVTVYDKGNYNEVASDKTDANGNYEIKVKEGEYVVIITADGYISFECDVKVVANEEQYIQTFLLIDEENLGIYGVAEGTIKNAVTGSVISDVQMSFRKGWNKQDGDVVLTTKTDSNGKYQVDLPVGNYTAHMEKAGYVSNTLNIIVLPVSVMQQNGALVPTGDGLPEGDLRIVLTWGSSPSDLDSHLVGPAADGNGYFHIYYSNKQYSYNSTKYADLDLDDTSSYGPETTTIYKKTENGTYSFYVHDYSNRGYSSSTAMSASGAIVEVYVDGQFYAGYPVPTGKQGTYWHVFDYNPTENTITPVNEFKDGITYGASQRARMSTEVQFDMNK